MKAKNVLDKLKDLKLRRWGSAEFLRRVKIDYEFLQETKNYIENSIGFNFDDDCYSIDDFDDSVIEDGVELKGNRNAAGYVIHTYNEITEENCYIFVTTNELSLLKEIVNIKYCNFNWIDLGLPSGTLWADRNIGANYAENNGKYFYPCIANCVNNFTPEIDEAVVQDIALYDGCSNAPSKEDFEELVEGTTRTKTELNGVEGILFSSKVNENSIFIPFSGYYETAARPYFIEHTTRLTTSSFDTEYVYNFSIYNDDNCGFDYDAGYMSNAAVVRLCRKIK